MRTCVTPLTYALFLRFFDDYRMVIGPTRDGSFVEVGVNLSGQVFHAMPARPKFLR